MGHMGDGPAEAARGTAPGTHVAPPSADSRRAALLDIVEISEDECILLLATQDMGRLAVVLGGKPQIFPVNYGIDERTLIFRTAPGTKLMASTLGDIAFEVDAFDPVSLQGWAVEVRGLGRDVTSGLDATSVRLRSVELLPWVAGAKDHWIAIVDPVFSGRRLVPRMEQTPLQ